MFAPEAIEGTLPPAIRQQHGDSNHRPQSCCSRGRLREWFGAARIFYRLRFTYPEGWEINLGGHWEQHFYVAEGRCDGAICGRFRGANYPRSSSDGTFGRTSGL